jgi:hypothetical protein
LHLSEHKHVDIVSVELSLVSVSVKGY